MSKYMRDTLIGIAGAGLAFLWDENYIDAILILGLGAMLAFYEWMYSEHKP